jgi:hypothetical protein
VVWFNLVCKIVKFLHKDPPIRRFIKTQNRILSTRKQQGTFPKMKAELNLPAGFRFHPTDEELVKFYLCRRCASEPINVPVIAEIDLYKFNPWELPGKTSVHDKIDIWFCELTLRF